MISFGPSASLVGFSPVFSPTIYIGPHAGPDNSTRGRLTVPWANLPQNASVFDLLTWRSRISEFAGRDDETAALQNWAEGRQAVSVKFIVGEGGVGKTRLAAEFADTLREHGWQAGFVDLGERKAYRAGRAGTLLVVDYPEYNREGVRRLLEKLAGLGRVKRRMRVLFLTRQNFEDWEDFVRDSGALPLVDKMQLGLDTSPLDGP